MLEPLEGAFRTPPKVARPLCELCKFKSPTSPGLTENAKRGSLASHECLNCNIALCIECKTSHIGNARLQNHLIKDYSEMVADPHDHSDDDASNQARPALNKLRNYNGPFKGLMSRIRPRHSSEESRNAAQALAALTKTSQMQCYLHPANNVTHYSLHMREYLCKDCIREHSQSEYFAKATTIGEALQALQKSFD